MGFFSRLFKKEVPEQEEQKTEEQPVAVDSALDSAFERLRQAQVEEDFVRQVELYYLIGGFYKEKMEKERAHLYLERAYSLINSQDEIYHSVSKKIKNSCVNWLNELEREGIYTLDVLEEVEEKAEDMTLFQRCQWNFLTIARVESLLERFSYLTGCEVFHMLSDAAFLSVKSYYVEEFQTQKNLDYLNQFVEELYQFIDTYEFASYKSRVFAKGGDFQLYDFNGFDMMLNLQQFFSSYMEALEDDFEHSKEKIPVDFIVGGLLTDYYLRTTDKEIHEVEEIKEEKERIFNDYRFLMENPSEDEFFERLEQYEMMELIK